MPLSQVDTLTDAQVEEMLADEAKLTEFTKRLPFVQDYQLREQSVKALQQEVDSLEARLQADSELDSIRRERDAKLAEFEQKNAQKQAKDSEFTPAVLCEKLGAKARDVDGECEEIVSQFLAGEMNGKDFAKAYKEKRIHFHTLSAKKESILINM